LLGAAVLLTLDALADILRKKYPNANYAVIKKVKRNFNSGNYNEIKVDLYNGNGRKMQRASIEAEEISDEIEEGEVLELY
ncbi:hypothetical protein Q5M86_10665, partial [Brachyspira innocens]